MSTRDALSVIAQQASRLTRLVDDMLVLARADGGGYPVVMTKLDAAALVGECVHELASRAAEKGITVRCSLDPITVTGDDALLRRLCSNLLANALAYTTRGGTVDVTLRRAEGIVELRVGDTGPGIPAEEHERVFERFVPTGSCSRLRRRGTWPRDRPMGLGCPRRQRADRVEQSGGHRLRREAARLNGF